MMTKRKVKLRRIPCLGVLPSAVKSQCEADVEGKPMQGNVMMIGMEAFTRHSLLALAVARVGVNLLAVDTGLHHRLGSLHLPSVGQNGCAASPSSTASSTHSTQVFTGLLGEVEQDDVIHLQWCVLRCLSVKWSSTDSTESPT